MRPMRIIDRFTRDRVSRYVWAFLTIVCLSTVLIAGQRQTTSLRNEISATQAEALQIANSALEFNLSYQLMISAIPAPIYRDITLALQSAAFGKYPDIALVRIWRPDGTLQFSTHERDQVGLLKTQDTTLIDQAMKGQVVTERVNTKFSASSTGNDQTPTNLLEVFVPLHVPDRISVAGVAEVDFYYDSLVQASHHPWFKLIVIFVVLAALCLIMTLLSFRTPLKTLGAGVVFEHTPEPAARRSGKHAPSASSDKTAKNLQRDAEQASARASKAEAEATSMRVQLGESHDQLKQAEEAYHFLEAKMKQQQTELATATAAAADTTQVTELQMALAEAEAKLTAARADHPEDALASRISELEGSLAGKDQERSALTEELTSLKAELATVTASLEAARTEAAASADATAGAQTDAQSAVAQAQTDAQAAIAQAQTDAQAAIAQAQTDAQAAVAEAEAKIAAAEAAAAPPAEAAADTGGTQAALTDELTSTKAELATAQADLLAAQTGLSTAQTELATAQAGLATAQAEAEAAKAKVEAAKVEAAASAAAAALAAPPPATPATEPPPAIDDAALTQLEERIVAAEERAKTAESRLTELQTAIKDAADSPTADETAAAVGDLRLRLARTASRKKLGGDEGSLASRGETAAVKSPEEVDLQRSMIGDIRGPVSTLKGISQSLKGEVSSGEGKELVRQMNATVKKLDRLAADLAEVGDISSGSVRLNRRRSDLEALVSRVVSEADGIKELDVRMELEPARASVDPVRVQQIVDGLLSNARERTNVSGTIRIRLTGDDDGATIAVDDEGDADAQPGPQLLLASKLAELHGGRLWSEPRTSGEGASVKVFLPASPRSEPES